MNFKTIFFSIAILILGAIGALVFEFFVFPYLLSDSKFSGLQVVRNFKEGKIVVNQTQQIYIQENWALENAIKNSEKSIVAIQKNGIIVGSGLIATSDGSVITLASLVPAGSKISVYFNGEAVSYTIEKRDFKNNLALIKINKDGLPTMGFADKDKITVGQRVFIAGLKGLKEDSWFANEGIIRSFDQDYIKTNILEKNIASGTPLLNILGELVGLSFIDSDSKISAITADTIKTFLGI